MRKIVVLLIAVLAFVGCKESSVKTKKEDIQKKVTKNPKCDELSRLKTDEEIKLWIDQNKDELCDGTLFECILEAHKISFQDYYIMVKDYWKLANPKYKSFTWLEIKNKIQDRCYPDYLGFKIDNNNDITDLKITSFTTTETCYSIPLFKAIDKINNGLKDTDEFFFTKGLVGGKEKIIFFIDNRSLNNIFFLDISDNPTFQLL